MDTVGEWLSTKSDPDAAGRVMLELRECFPELKLSEVMDLPLDEPTLLGRTNGHLETGRIPVPTG